MKILFYRTNETNGFRTYDQWGNNTPKEAIDIYIAQAKRNHPGWEWALLDETKPKEEQTTYFW